MLKVGAIDLDGIKDIKAKFAQIDTDHNNLLSVPEMIVEMHFRQMLLIFRTELRAASLAGITLATANEPAAHSGAFDGRRLRCRAMRCRCMASAAKSMLMALTSSTGTNFLRCAQSCTSFRKSKL